MDTHQKMRDYMSKHNKFKSKYDKIPKYPSALDPEPWLEYPSLIEEMLEVIKSQEETMERWCRDGIPSRLIIEE